MSWSYLFVVSGATLILAYYLYVPFPEQASDPWGKSVSAAYSKSQRACTIVSDYLKLVPTFQLRRWLDTLTDMARFSKPAVDIEVSLVTVNAVPAELYKPRGISTDQRLPGLIYIHGGGWISRSAASYKELASYLAVEAEAIVISIDYRLAPEHPFPLPFEDCLKVTRYVLENAAKYNMLRNKISIAGDDNGGNLALAVALNLSTDTTREPSIPGLCAVGVFYAPLQAMDFSLPSYINYNSGPGILHTDDVIRQYIYYLFGERNTNFENHFKDNLHVDPGVLSSNADIFDTEWLPFSFRKVKTSVKHDAATNMSLWNDIKQVIVDPRFSPMLAPVGDLEKLPLTYFIAAAFDPLRDESFMAYARLRDINMANCEHVYYPSEQHGFLEEFATNAVAAEALRDYIKYIKENTPCK